MSRKGANLVNLAEAGVTVPRGFTLDGSHYRAAVEGFTDQILSSIGQPRIIAQLFSELPMQESTVNFLRQELAAIAAADRYAVRSSGSVVESGSIVEEDSFKTALAGQFDSFLQVPLAGVPLAIRRCWASLFNQRSVASFNIDAEYIRRSNMSVVIQEMVPAAASGVMMTADPLGDGTTGSIDLTVGPCEALVAGLVSPDEVIFSRNDGSILSYEIGLKERRVVYDDFSEGNNSRTVDNSPTVSSHPSVAPQTVHSLIELGSRIEAVFGAPQDIELVITVNGDIVVTQARPVTCLTNPVTPFPIRNQSNKE
ncbi:MAG: PEP/pyruvate-binding domain-containing protein [Actinomycetota bacterium]